MVSASSIAGRRPTRWLRRGLLCALALLFSVLAAEVGLRVWNPIVLRTRGDDIVLPTRLEFRFQNVASAKLDRDVVVRRNSLGCRGPEPPADFAAHLTLVAMGGSSTECWALTEGKTWCDLLASALDRSLSGTWLANAGLDGHSTFGHLRLLEQVVARLRPDYLLLLVGLNDLDRTDLNEFDVRIDPAQAGLGAWLVRHSEFLSTIQALWRSLAAKQLGLEHKWELDPRTAERRADAPEAVAAYLSRQDQGCLPGYERRLRLLVELARGRGIRPILLTQPSLFGDFVDPATGVAFGELRFAGHCARTLGLALERYNDVTRRVAKELGVPCFDLAAELPKDSRLFYDWFHFGNAGAVAVAEVLARHLVPLLRAAHPEHAR